MAKPEWGEWWEFWISQPNDGTITREDVERGFTVLRIANLTPTNVPRLARLYGVTLNDVEEGE